MWMILSLKRKPRPDFHPIFAEWFKTTRTNTGADGQEYFQERYIRQYHWQPYPSKDLTTAQPNSRAMRYIPDLSGPYLYHDVMTWPNGYTEDYTNIQPGAPTWTSKEEA